MRVLVWLSCLLLSAAPSSITLRQCPVLSGCSTAALPVSLLQLHCNSAYIHTFPYTIHKSVTHNNTHMVYMCTYICLYEHPCMNSIISGCLLNADADDDDDALHLLLSLYTTGSSSTEISVFATPLAYRWPLRNSRLQLRCFICSALAYRFAWFVCGSFYAAEAAYPV